MTKMAATGSRLASLDQFRGYIVAGMCLVNFLAPFAAVHSVLKHNDTYFSYADSIMPGFLFVVGYSFRLTYLRRRREWSRLRTALSYVRRSGKLLLLSLGIYLFVGDVPRWFQFREMPPEFAPYRAEPPSPRSFEVLLSRAKVEHAGADSPAIIESASRLGEMIKNPEPKDAVGKARFQVANEAARQALDEVRDFVPSAAARIRAWNELDSLSRLLVHWRILAAKLLKSELWETLALIAVTQLVVLPWIGCSVATRLGLLAGLGIVHSLLAYWFGWDFVYGVPGNGMSKLWMTGDDRSWDGGCFGPVGWAIAMTGGTLAYDLVAGSASRAASAVKLGLWGAALMFVGYSLSCLTRLYDLSQPQCVELRERCRLESAGKSWLKNVIDRQREIAKERRRLLALGAATPDHQKLSAEIERLEASTLVLEDQVRAYPDRRLAPSPVLPPWEQGEGRAWSDLLAEPPFVTPPADDPQSGRSPPIEHRLRNYWMLGKRMPNVSFMLFATGFQFAALGLFVVACDMWGWQLGLFRTFGTNPLAAYFFHGAVGLVFLLVLPHDLSLPTCLGAFAMGFSIVYLLVRTLEKRGLYWRL